MELYWTTPSVFMVALPVKPTSNQLPHHPKRGKKPRLQGMDLA